MPNELESFSRPSEQNIADLGKEKTRQLTFGEKLVGITFNPAGDDSVAKAKRLFADAADLLYKEVQGKDGEISHLQSQLYEHAIGEILNAQMNVVKVLTLKY